MLGWFRSALMAASVAAAVAVGVGAAQADPPPAATSGGLPVPGPLPPVGSVATTPTTPPSTPCGPATGGTGLVQTRLQQDWPDLMQNWPVIAPGGLWLDNDAQIARIDVLDASQIPALCAQAVAHGAGGDLAIDVVPTTQAQMSEMANTVQSALQDRVGVDRARATFGMPGIKTWSIDIQIQPGVDRAAVDAIAQTVPAAYSVSEATAPFPIAVPTAGAALAPAAKPVAIVPTHRGRAAARGGLRVRVTGVKSASQVSVAVVKGATVVARATTTAPKTSSSAGAEASLRIAIPRSAIKTHGTTTFAVRVTMIARTGSKTTSTSRLKVS